MKKTSIILLCLFTAVACSRKPIQIPQNADEPFKDFISAYTSGMISKSQAVRLVLKDSLPLPYIEDPALLKKHLKTTPTFDYELEIKRANVVSIKPTKHLASGTRYKIDVDIEGMLDTTLQTSHFPMVFETHNQDFNLTSLKLSPQNINKPNSLVLKGTITTNDLAQFAQVKKMLTKIGDKPLNQVKWRKEGSRNFMFEIENIAKKEKSYTMAIVLDGSTIGIDRTYETKTIVPAIEEFKLSEWKYTSNPDQVLTLTFTEQLDEGQNLKGFVEIEDIKKYTYTISGNTVSLFLNNSFTGNTKLKLFSGIKNYMGKKSKQNQEFDMVIDEPLPSVEIIGKGTILPNSQGLIVPFKTIGLKKIDVDIYKIYEKNILQFLQVNDIADNSQLRRVAENVKSTTIDLTKKNKNNLKQWTTHGLNLRELITPELGAIYRVRFSFSQPYTFCQCEEERPSSYYSEYYDYYENDRYNNRKNETTCDRRYYYYSTRSKNLLASDLGVVLKRGTQDNYTIVSTNLVAGTPHANTKLQFYNYQQKLIRETQTNEQGIANITLKEVPYVLIASKGKNKAYLKTGDGYANSLSKFETEGITRTDGVDAFFYGERGVWRPGDDIHLSFMIRDEFKKLAEGLPMKLTFKNPKDQMVSTHKLKLTTSGIHTITLKTDADAPTGTYGARLEAGGYSFYTSLKVETVRPNRLKIHLKPRNEHLNGAQAEQIDIHAEWLHGAKANGLKTTVTMALKPLHTTFSKFKNFLFEDVSRGFQKTEKVIYNSTLNQNGSDTIQLAPLQIKSKGKLKASLVTKVFEKGGGFSIDQMNTVYHPYSTYVGMHIPHNQYGALGTNQKHTIELVCVDTKGNLNTKKDTLKLKIYKLEWRWWWRHNNEDLASYVSNNSYNLIEDKTLITQGGKADYIFEMNEYNWGQYYIQATDLHGHSTGTTVYVDFPGNERNQAEQNSATLLQMSSDKAKYETGQTAKISFPSPGVGKALISIENDIEVLKTFWVNTKKGTSSFTIKMDKEMAPNCYAHITVLQKHLHEKNDLPLRMYGVLPLTVFNKNSVLNPQIVMQEEFRPEENTVIKVKEQNGRGMHYTLAIVDEGLLDLTRFYTPDVWQHFNQKRALGVSTWDVYDEVINSFSGKFDNVYRIGGDGTGKGGNAAKAQRFKPAVKFLGPFYLKPGEQAAHKIKITNYVGSVRAMVVCRSRNAFGKVDKTAKVRKPLMIQANAPRVLTPNDKMEIPVTVFATEKVTFPITIQIESNELLHIAQKTITLNEVRNNEAVVFFKTKVNAKTGVAKLRFTATCANDKHSETMEIPIRMPGYEIDQVQDTTLATGQEATFTFGQLGWEGTNSAVLEVSQYPSINLDKRLRYLIQYPHGCIEQTTSSVFPQLYLPELTNLPQDKAKRVEKNIEEGIKRIQKFTTMSGGFAYWPGGHSPSSWGTTYAGHFLLEAKSKGYYVPDYMLEKWYTYQVEQCNAYERKDGEYYHRYQSELNQAYRLFTLALYGKPEIGAMNRLKENGIVANTTKWRLASAYMLAGKEKAAESLISSISYEVKSYRDDYYSYGSEIRDEAVIVECMKNQNQLMQAMQRLAKNLGSNRWMSTQETAYGLCAFAQVVGNTKKGSAAYRILENKDKAKNVKFTDVISQTHLSKVLKNNKVTIKNTGTKPLYFRLINRGTPPSNTLTTSASKLQMNVHYFGADGMEAKNDSLRFGEDYTVTVTVKNMNPLVKVNNFALSTFFPAGCEIQNNRLFNANTENTVDYEDIKDDKVYTYFGLSPLQSRSVSYRFTASFKGEYLHPGVHCEAMYDAEVYALVKGKTIVVR